MFNSRLKALVVLGPAILLFALAAGIASADEAGVNGWCFRPTVIWHSVPDTEAYVPSITCQERDLPSGDGDQWSSETTADIATAPDDWTLPERSIRQTTRCGWVHEYDASTGRSYVYGPMDRNDGHSPTDKTQPDVYLSVGCSASGDLGLSLISDAAPLDGAHAIVWWTDRSQYRRAEVWEAEELSEGSDFYRAWAPGSAELWAEIRDSSRLYVLIFGQRSWHFAEAFVQRINQLDIVEMLDYCSQNQQEAADLGSTT